MAGDNTLVFTDMTFDADVLKSDIPVVVDFWAEGCRPCSLMSPTVDQIATDYDGRVKVGKLDVGSNQETAARYGIRGVPTILAFQKWPDRRTEGGSPRQTRLPEDARQAHQRPRLIHFPGTPWWVETLEAGAVEAAILPA